MAKFVPDTSTPGLRGYVDAARGRIEIWCIQELMSPSKSGSSTEEKARVLPSVLTNPDVVLVIAFGTAATPTTESLNGNVVVGTKTFCHDPKPKDSSSHWIPPSPDEIVESSLSRDVFMAMTAEPLASRVKASLIPVPIDPAKDPQVILDYDYVALGDVNVTNYKDYVWADKEVVDTYRKLGYKDPIGSLETTHAVIRACTQAPFMFVSGITDRVGQFEKEVGSGPYGQNFVAGHNAALAISYMMPQIAGTVLIVQ